MSLLVVVADTDATADQNGFDVVFILSTDIELGTIYFDFNIAEVVRFEGDTGPYVQYTNARAQSILRKAGVAVDTENITLDDAATWDIITALNAFPDTVRRAFAHREPSVIAKYALGLARAFNKYYANSKILADDENKNGRLALVAAVSETLTVSLSILGVKAPKEM